jgi:large subunit ribosomal protein L21
LLLARSSNRIARPESDWIPVTTQHTAICGQLNEILSMYAVIESGGKQHRVEPGELLRLEKLNASEGETVNFDKVMMIGEGENIQIGTPFVDGGAVTAEVVSHGRGDKITIIKMRRRKHYRRQAGHRQYFTEVKIKEISGGN